MSDLERIFDSDGQVRDGMNPDEANDERPPMATTDEQYRRKREAMLRSLEASL